MCYYFDDIIKDIGIKFSNALLDKKLNENISVYDISNKTSAGPKPLCVRFDKIDGFIRVCGEEFRHLVWFDCGWFDQICDKIKYLISERSGITDNIIIVLEVSELNHITLNLLKNIDYSLCYKNKNTYHIFIKSFV